MQSTRTYTHTHTYAQLLKHTTNCVHPCMQTQVYISLCLCYCACTLMHCIQIRCILTHTWLCTQTGSLTHTHAETKWGNAVSTQPCVCEQVHWRKLKGPWWLKEPVHTLSNPIHPVFKTNSMQRASCCTQNSVLWKYVTDCSNIITSGGKSTKAEAIAYFFRIMV